MASAIYIVVIDDSNEADEELAQHVEDLDRLEGDLMFSEASDKARRIADMYRGEFHL